MPQADTAEDAPHFFGRDGEPRGDTRYFFAFAQPDLRNHYLRELFGHLLECSLWPTYLRDHARNVSSMPMERMIFDLRIANSSPR